MFGHNHNTMTTRPSKILTLLTEILEQKQTELNGLKFKLKEGKQFLSGGQLWTYRCRRFVLNREIKSLQTKIKSYEI